MSSQTITLDVRTDIRNGCEPFSKIMSTVASLGDGDALLLIAPFEPVPLFHVLAKQGFNHAAQKTVSGDWEVLFTRDAIGTVPSEPEAPHSNRSCGRRSAKPSQVIELDARGLEPPQPLVTILEALAALPDGAELRAWTDRRPLHLYAQLEERNFTGKTEEAKNGSFITHIRRS